MTVNLNRSAGAGKGANPGLALLIRLRWLALGGQAGLFCFSAVALGLEMPWAILLPCMLLTAVTNFAAARFNAAQQLRKYEGAVCGLLLVLDTLTLTVMLLYTGGSHNPFAIFYLLHVAIAAVLLSYPMAWAMVALAGLCYASLFASGQTLTALSAQEFCGGFDFHLHGMLLSMVLVGMGVAFFIGKLKIALARREQELEQARQRNERNERFAALATLAAGVAHELATPLGTIALAGEDLEQQASEGCFSNGCLKDAQLIRAEVMRCCTVLEKLRQQTTGGTGDAAEELALAEIPLLLRPYLSQQHWQALEFTNRSVADRVYLPRTALLQSLSVLVKNACQSAEPVKAAAGSNAGGNAATGAEAPAADRAAVSSADASAAFSADAADGVGAEAMFADAGHRAAACRVLLCVSDVDGGICFTVEDAGSGMSAETIARLGEPFFTTKEPGRGMGLGLFLVRMFVERIAGGLTVDSAPGKGTRISIVVPLPEEGF